MGPLAAAPAPAAWAVDPNIRSPIIGDECEAPGGASPAGAKGPEAMRERAICNAGFRLRSRGRFRSAAWTLDGAPERPKLRRGRASMADETPETAAQPLARGMRMLGVLFLTLSAATPASSIFVIVPDVVSQAGTGALISMLLAAAIALGVGQVYAELSSAFPLAGGEYAIVGRVMGPLAGFVVLALNLANSLLATAVLALGVSDYLGAVIPGLSPSPRRPGGGDRLDPARRPQHPHQRPGHRRLRGGGDHRPRGADRARPAPPGPRPRRRAGASRGARRRRAASRLDPRHRPCGGGRHLRLRRLRLGGLFRRGDAGGRPGGSAAPSCGRSPSSSPPR